MNATEEGDEPLGEAPFLGGNTFGSPIQDRRGAAIAEIRAIHRPAIKLSADTIPDDETVWACGVCAIKHDPGERYDTTEHIEYPCPTIQALDKWGA